MIYYPRVESRELLTLRSLYYRNNLSKKEKQYYLSIEKGYEGEKQFDLYLETFSRDWLFVNNLLLKENKSYFQIDSLGISQEILYLFDVKNYEGDYVVTGDKWETTMGKEINNPLHQLNRCETLLKKFLQARGKNLHIKSFLIFINPHFTLYQAPRDSTIIFPTQINHFMEKLQPIQAKLNKYHYELADLFVSADQKAYPNPFIPTYEYEQVNKGIICSSCHSLIANKYSNGLFGKLTCKRCSSSEKLELSLLKSVKEFQVLFPERKITTVEIYNWCNGLLSMKSIQRLLSKNFHRQGYGKYSYYE